MMGAKELRRSAYRLEQYGFRRDAEALRLVADAIEVRDRLKMARQITALVLAAACLCGVLALTGCAGWHVRSPGYYEWTKTLRTPMEWYRWEVVGEEFYHYCGFYSMPSSEGECVARIERGVLQPGDRNIDTGIARTAGGIGKLCIVYSTMDEDTAASKLDSGQQMSLAVHAIAGHCKGRDHQRTIGGMK